MTGHGDRLSQFCVWVFSSDLVIASLYLAYSILIMLGNGPLTYFIYRTTPFPNFPSALLLLYYPQSQ